MEGSARPTETEESDILRLLACGGFDKEFDGLFDGAFGGMVHGVVDGAFDETFDGMSDETSGGMIDGALDGLFDGVFDGTYSEGSARPTNTVESGMLLRSVDTCLRRSVSRITKLGCQTQLARMQ